MNRTIKEELSEIRFWMVPFLIVLVIPLSVIDYFSANRWFCDFMGWHRRPKEQGFDGCSFNGKCPRCKEDVLQDGQGNWF